MGRFAFLHPETSMDLVREILERTKHKRDEIEGQMGLFEEVPREEAVRHGDAG